LDAPQPVARVAHGHARLRTGEVLFDEAIGGFGRRGGAARSETKVGRLGEGRFTPDPMVDGDEAPRAGAPDLPSPAQIPYEVDGPHGGHRPRSAERRVPEELAPAHSVAVCKNVPRQAAA